MSGLDREPYRPVGAYGWYFRVNYEHYGFYQCESEAWDAYERTWSRVYTDEEEDA